MALGSGPSLIEASLPAAVEVDFSLKVKGTKAAIGVLTSRELNPSQVSLGYAILSNGSVVIRSQIGGDSLAWSEDGN
jgi:hypothetical protein